MRTTEATYGLTFEAVNKVSHSVMTVAEWGAWAECTDRPEYSLTQICLNEDGVQPMHFYLHREGAYFVENGAVLVRFRSKDGQLGLQKLVPGHVFHFAPGLAHSLCGLEASTVYSFSNRVSPEDCFYLETDAEAVASFLEIDPAAVSPSSVRTLDYRDKYWGSIETILNGEVAGKRIFLRANAQSSLEFHCVKTESYFVHAGKVRVGLRVGRGENKSVVLGRGDSFDVRPGLMHIRIGIEDSVIIEISTRDSDRDSHLVEDGQKYRHEET